MAYLALLLLHKRFQGVDTRLGVILVTKHTRTRMTSSAMLTLQWHYGRSCLRSVFDTTTQSYTDVNWGNAFIVYLQTSHWPPRKPGTTEWLSSAKSGESFSSWLQQNREIQIKSENNRLFGHVFSRSANVEVKSIVNSNWLAEQL